MQFAVAAPVSTDISAIEKASKTSVVYNLQGIRIATPIGQLPKGIYIINGQKVKK